VEIEFESGHGDVEKGGLGTVEISGRRTVELV